MKNWSRLEIGCFVAFLFWCVVGLIFTLGHFTPTVIATWPIPSWLMNFVTWCVRTGDPILILLAFANTHLHAARQWSVPRARRWGLLILVSSLAIETWGVSTGYPFGRYQYSDRFGPMLGVVPFTIPLAWHVVITNALFLVRNIAPHLTSWTTAAWVGLLCTFYDFILEPFATSSKGYWRWNGDHVPLTNYLSWYVFTGLLTGLFAPSKAMCLRRDPRPFLLLGLTLLIFLAGGWI